MRYYRQIPVALLIMVGLTHAFPAAAAPEVIIREIQVAGASADDEFIELENTTDRTIDLTGWKLRKRTQSGSESSIKDFSFGSGFSLDIPGQGTLLWTNRKGMFAPLTDTRLGSGASLTDNNTVALLDDQGAIIDAVTYGTSHLKPFPGSTSIPVNPPKGQTLLRENGSLTLVLSESSSPTNTAVIREKIIAPSAPPLPAAPSDDSKSVFIRINELFPNPPGDDAEGEFIELYNMAAEPVDISGFVLRDASSNGSYTFPEASVLSGGAYLTIPRKESGISLNNTEETISLSDRNNSLVDRVSYETSKEGASYGHDGSSFRFSRFLTPGTGNRFGGAPGSAMDIPNKIYKGVPASFSADGSKDRDYLWDFGDGGASRRQNPSHTYEDTGTFQGSLEVSDGIEKSVRGFSVEVKKFPEPDISFSAIAPNPKGSDEGREWISLKNKGKKKIDLLGFSIAAGSSRKKLSNHPIRESFVLKPGKEGILTSAISSFSLGNEKGFVELRKPDGTVITKASYSKKGGVADDEVWRKEKNAPWRWSQRKTVPLLVVEPRKETRNAPVKNDAKEATPRSVDAEKEAAPESPKNITLENLSPEDRARLEAQIEEKVRQKIFGQLLEEQAFQNLPQRPRVLGDSDDKSAPYSGNFFQNLNQAISAFLSKE